MRKPKKPKKRAKKYDGKLFIEGTLDQVLKVSIPEPKEEKPKKGK